MVELVGGSNEKKIVVGTKRFIVTFIGTVPPEIEALGEAAMAAWATNSFAINAGMVQFLETGGCEIQEQTPLTT